LIPMGMMGGIVGKEKIS
jgi:hypothetical protein